MLVYLWKLDLIEDWDGFFLACKSLLALQWFWLWQNFRPLLSLSKQKKFPLQMPKSRVLLLRHDFSLVLFTPIKKIHYINCDFHFSFWKTTKHNSSTKIILSLCEKNLSNWFTSFFTCTLNSSTELWNSNHYHLIIYSAKNAFLKENVLCIRAWVLWLLVHYWDLRDAIGWEKVL